jgi:hypothetical protein
VVSPFLWKFKRRILSVPKQPALGGARTEEEYAYGTGYTIGEEQGSPVGA